MIIKNNKKYNKKRKKGPSRELSHLLDVVLIKKIHKQGLKKYARWDNIKTVIMCEVLILINLYLFANIFSNPQHDPVFYSDNVNVSEEVQNNEESVSFNGTSSSNESYNASSGYYNQKPQKRTAMAGIKDVLKFNFDGGGDVDDSAALIASSYDLAIATSIKNQADQIEVSVILYRNMEKRTPRDFEDLLREKYLKSVPSIKNDYWNMKESSGNYGIYLKSQYITSAICDVVMGD